MPTIDDCLDRLKRAGWGVGHAAFGATWQVDGTNGENALLARGATLEEAYRLTCTRPGRSGCWRRRGSSGAAGDAPVS